MVIKKDDPPPPPTVSTGLAKREEMYQRKLEAYEIIHRVPESSWDTIEAKQIPAAIVDYVAERLEEDPDVKYRTIRRELGISSDHSKLWRGILANLKLGYRVHGPAFFARILTKNSRVEDGLQKLTEALLERANNAPDEKKYLHLTKELTGAVESLNKLRQGTVQVGKMLGIFTDGDSKSNQGPTFIIKQNFQLPNQAEVDKHRTIQIEKARDATEQMQKVHEAKPKT